jgi:hypothetical protein
LQYTFILLMEGIVWGWHNNKNMIFLWKYYLQRGLSKRLSLSSIFVLFFLGNLLFFLLELFIILSSIRKYLIAVYDIYVSNTEGEKSNHLFFSCISLDISKNNAHFKKCIFEWYIFWGVYLWTVQSLQFFLLCFYFLCIHPK